MVVAWKVQGEGWRKIGCDVADLRYVCTYNEITQAGGFLAVQLDLDIRIMFHKNTSP